ncbi:MAG TPA: hypothetical protein VIV58_17405 [Kofleriaceae bacterium]
MVTSVPSDHPQIVPARAAEHRKLVRIHGDRIRLYDKLARELLQSEHDAHLHGMREAQRQADRPARAMLAIAYHAQRTELELRRLVVPHQPVGAMAALGVAKTFSHLRHFALDRLLAHERTYRATLLGMRHGLDAAHLLSAVADRARRGEVRDFCDRLIEERTPLIEAAVEVVGWFADHPRLALTHA